MAVPLRGPAGIERVACVQAGRFRAHRVHGGERAFHGVVHERQQHGGVRVGVECQRGPGPAHGPHGSRSIG
ncbi:MAG: hypothetical protein Q7V88_07955, partial [Actinomycetota bacterium]|nr:hypothetical protein [Actinomycetota bacterium]